jgi:two-component system, OmpR family, sensor histidine kinase KdpD
VRVRFGNLTTIGQAFATAAGVLAIAALCRVLSLNATAVALSFLLFVLVIATRWGLWAAILASAIATLLFNFLFLPPVGTLTIADPQNWIALAAFLITAVIASELSNRAQRQAAAAIEQRREVERLYQLSRSVLLDTGEHGPGSTITHQIAASFGFESVLFYDLATRNAYSAGPRDLKTSYDELESIKELTGLPDGSLAIAVRLGNKPVGVLAVRGEVGKPALEAIANLVAITVERAASQEMASRARAARKSEELKSSILDALAHEFKTPLTSIKAASTALLSRTSTHPDAQRELLTIIDEETDRLTNLVTEAIQASHIEAGRVKLARTAVDVLALVNRVVEQMKSRLDDRAVEVDIPDGLPAVMVDRDLIELAVRQLVDNALKYSRPGTPIVVHARATDETVNLSVTDAGPGLSPQEQQKIFEKFYRGEAVRHKLAGTGMGLNIVKDIVTAHSGTIHVQSSPNVGTTFIIELPAVREAGA